MKPALAHLASHLTPVPAAAYWATAPLAEKSAAAHLATAPLVDKSAAAPTKVKSAAAHLTELNCLSKI
jgi:hypothetical protein